jgi:hypothetical protein
MAVRNPERAGLPRCVAMNRVGHWANRRTGGYDVGRARLDRWCGRYAAAFLQDARVGESRQVEAGLTSAQAIYSMIGLLFALGGLKGLIKG